MPRYTIGIDFGTLSARAVLADAADGRVLAQGEFPYPHGVMEAALPDGTPLGLDWALQHPGDYLEALEALVPPLLREGRVSPEDVIGIGTDVTASTVFPVREDGTPLCCLPEYAHRPHAWAKLWKHQAAQEEADRITALALARKEPWLDDYGGRVSATWLVPKAWELFKGDPKLYAAMDHYVEAADWIVWQLCGALTRNACSAGYKSFYSTDSGHPSQAFLRALDPGLETLYEDKLSGPVLPVGSRAGGLTKGMAALLGLREGTAVAAGMVDAHACVPAAGITGPGEMLSILGTSGCHIMLGTGKAPVPGICGAVPDGVLPGFTGYEAGQVCYGDHFAWLAERFTPPEYHQEAKVKSLSLHGLLSEKAALLKPGASGLLALDWFNGNRSVLVDSGLSGLILGLTLRTRAEEVYRALMEATAFGARLIFENYRRHGAAVDRVCAIGGISQKSPLAMQIFADVQGMPVRVPKASQGGALGSAILAAKASGARQGGYDDVFEAVRRMGAKDSRVYRPQAEHAQAYDTLFYEYERLHDYFGRGGNGVMKRLKALKAGITPLPGETRQEI